VQRDLATALDRLAPAGAGWVHDTEGPDDMPAHVKAMLTACRSTCRWCRARWRSAPGRALRGRASYAAASARGGAAIHRQPQRVAISRPGARLKAPLVPPLHEQSDLLRGTYFTRIICVLAAQDDALSVLM